MPNRGLRWRTIGPSARDRERGSAPDVETMPLDADCAGLTEDRGAFGLGVLIEGDRMAATEGPRRRLPAGPFL
jgi:hypothetical protein